MSLSPIFVRDLPRTLAPAAAPEEAYAEVLPLIEAVTDEQIVFINLDIPSVVSVVLAKAPQLQTLAADADRQLKDFDTTRLARLPKIALALAYAHTVLLAGTTVETDELGALYENAVALRTRLMDDAGYLVKKGLLEASRLEQIKGLTGYRNAAFDLMVLVKVMSDSWTVATRNSAVREEDVAKAREVAARILQALSVREQIAAETAKATVMRQKAYTLLFRECDAIQRVVSYLRWEQDDADSFAPSVFSSRRRPRKASDTPVAPGAAPVVSPTPLDDEEKAPAPPSPRAVLDPKPASSFAPVPPGHQGGSPFTS